MKLRSMRTISHTQNRWRGRESIFLSDKAQTSLTVTVFITTQQDQVTLQIHSKPLLFKKNTETQSELRSDPYLRTPTSARD